MIKKNPFDLYENDKLYGIYRGVVEQTDEEEDEKLGRCKIRVFGVHTKYLKKEPTQGIPTEELPWARPALSLFEGSITGFGAFMVPLKGSHVAVYFENGEHLFPVYFATLPGKPEKENYFLGKKEKYGFMDPDEKYPIEEKEPPHKPNELGESEYHKLALNEKVEEDTIVKSKKEKLDEDVEKADGNTWSEPKPYYEAKYPYNKVISTHSGITIEIDDTEEKERIHVYHPSNSYVEINGEGDIIVRNEGSKFEIIKKTRNQHVLKDENKTIDENRTKDVGQDQYEYIGQNEYREISSDAHETIGGDEYKKVNGNINKKTIGNEYEFITMNYEKAVTGNVVFSVVGNTSIHSNGPVNVHSSASIACDAPVINLNSGISSSVKATIGDNPEKPK